jgi:hypothetical protein
MAGRLTLALHNSYDPRRFREAHRRALARAAPLAHAYEANLAALGFPTDEVAGDVETAPTDAGEAQAEAGPASFTGARDLARFVAETTTVGGGGDLFRTLADEGRFHLHDAPDPGFPPQLGTVVLATRDPGPAKDRSPRNVARSLLHDESTTLVVGLGPQGVPDSVREQARGHLDATGQGIPLETATAMGAVLAAVDAWRDALAEAPTR